METIEKVFENVQNLFKSTDETEVEQEAVPILDAPVQAPLPAPVPVLMEYTEEELFRMEAAVLTILNMNRCVITPEAKAILDEQYKNASKEDILYNIDVLAEYGIVAPTEENVMTGGDKLIVPEPRTKRIKIESLKFRQNKETEKYILELEEAIKNARLNADTLVLPQHYGDLADYIREAVEGICNNRSASVMLKALFPKPANIWMENMKNNCRDVYEPSGIATQCNNTIGKAKDPVIPDNNICYICGFGFDELSIDGATPEEIEGLKPTCEHILPIIQAIFFLDLYRSSEQKILTPEKMKVLRLEYSWAHQCCNYVKGDFSYLVTKLDKNKYPSWDFSPNSTNKILKGIYDTQNYAGTRIIQQEIGGDPTEWLKKQIYSIGVDKMAPILNHIEKSGNGGTVALIGLGNCLDTTKISEQFLDILNNLKANPNWQPIDIKKRKRGDTRRKSGHKKTKRRSI